MDLPVQVALFCLVDASGSQRLENYWTLFPHSLHDYAENPGRQVASNHLRTSREGARSRALHECFHHKGAPEELERAARHFREMLGHVDQVREMIAEARAKQAGTSARRCIR